MINSVRYAELGEARLARKKHIITCSGAPWHAVIEPLPYGEACLAPTRLNLAQS